MQCLTVGSMRCVDFVFDGFYDFVCVGEWVAEWMVEKGTKGDVERFAKAQIDVYGRASFGWAYWSYKNVNGHWSLQWMINNGYITL